MLLIGKTLVLLVLELIIEYLFGTMLTKLVLKREVNPLLSLLMGFLAYQALFQVIALVFIFTTGVLHHLTIVWGIIMVLTMILSIIVSRNIVWTQINSCGRLIAGNKKAFVVTGLVVLAFCYYASINGESNEDARYYIALMTTSVDTDSLFKHNVYNGYQVESLYLRRVLATFEIQGAVLSQLFGIHPLLIARVFRACQNVLLTSASVGLAGKTLFYQKDECVVRRTLMVIIVFWFVQILFANTIYTPGTFVLYRAYEAKAFTANLIVLFGIYLCVEQLRARDVRVLLLIIIFIWGSMAISTSASLIAGAECAIILIPVWMQRWIMNKKREKLHAN